MNNGVLQNGVHREICAPPEKSVYDRIGNCYKSVPANKTWQINHRGVGKTRSLIGFKHGLIVCSDNLGLFFFVREMNHSQISLIERDKRL